MEIVYNKLNIIESILESEWPLKFASNSWDNVGWIHKVNSKDLTSRNFNIIVSHDLTHEAIEDAIKYNAICIITYHPPIPKTIDSLSSIFNDKSIGIILDALKNSINIYSLHTALDNCPDNSISDWLASFFPEHKIYPALPIENPALAIQYPNAGLGRILEFNEPLSLDKILNIIKVSFDITKARVVMPQDIEVCNPYNIKRFGIGPGSSASIFRQSKKDVDFILLGDASYHNLRYFSYNNIGIILLEHTLNELPYMKNYFYPKLQELVTNLSEKCNVYFASNPHLNIEYIDL